MYSFEDMKEEISYSAERNDHESLLVPAEEIEEEAPLRIRTIQYESANENNCNVISIDLNKYIK
jgi:hypothetical protein